MSEMVKGAFVIILNFWNNTKLYFLCYVNAKLGIITAFWTLFGRRYRNATNGQLGETGWFRENASVMNLLTTSTEICQFLKC